MALVVQKVDYCYVNVPSRSGHGFRILSAVGEAGINLHAFTGFPVKRGVAQLDLVTDDTRGLAKLAKAKEWKLSKVKSGFLVHGDDSIGAALPPMEKLAKAKINVTAIDAVSAGNGRFGMILWVNPKDYRRAAKALGAK
ncbi:MAG: hypothetical protein ACREWG_07650 [Gammaproteobacteria bacterium]